MFAESTFIMAIYIYIWVLGVFLVTLCGLWDLSSMTMDPAVTLCIARQILNHWATREESLKIIL